MKTTILLLASLFAPVLYGAEPVEVLYITHLPGRYHDYKAQMEAFKKHVPRFTEVEVTYRAGNHDETVAFLKQPDFARDHDIIIYNLCMAHSYDTDQAYNMIVQTTEKGKPAILLHCAMHTFWATFGKPGSREAENTPRLKTEWRAKHPRLDFPDWSAFSGLDTKRHDKQRELKVFRAKPVHPIVKDFQSEWTIKKDELYVNMDFKSTATPVLKARSVQDKKEHVLAWVNQAGKGKVFGITLGHGMETFSDPDYHRVLANAIEFLTGK